VFFGGKKVLGKKKIFLGKKSFFWGEKRLSLFIFHLDGPMIEHLRCPNMLILE
jgi:hypothetical protein